MKIGDQVYSAKLNATGIIIDERNELKFIQWEWGTDIPPNFLTFAFEKDLVLAQNVRILNGEFRRTKPIKLATKTPTNDED